MKPLFDLFWDLCLLRRGPQDVPVSGALLALCVAAYLTVGVVTGSAGVSRLGVPLALTLALFEAAVLAGFVVTLLRFAGLSARLTQTLTALFGSGVLIGAVALPVWLWLRRVADAGQSAELPVLLVLLLLLWSLAVNGHILAAALSRPRMVGMLYAVGYFFGSWLLIDGLVKLLAGV